MNCDCNPKNKWPVLIGFTLGLVVLSVCVSWMTASWLSQKPDWSKHDEGGGHQWLHHELDLTPEQAAAIDAVEPEYRRKRAALEKQFQAKIDELREVIVHSQEFSAEAEAAIRELHVVHRQLQELSIRHYYQMMRVLPPEKQARLSAIAVQALSVPQ